MDQRKNMPRWIGPQVVRRLPGIRSAINQFELVACECLGQQKMRCEDFVVREVAKLKMTWPGRFDSNAIGLPKPGSLDAIRCSSLSCSSCSSCPRS